MSFVYKAVQDLVDDLLDHVKKEFDDYANTARQDLEVFADTLIRRAVKGVVVGLLGGVAVSAGLVFSLVGLVAYLSQVMHPAFAWGLVGLAMMGIGAAALYRVLRGHPRATKYAPRTHERN